MTYDELRRPEGLYVTEDGVERLARQTVYGEGMGDVGNHRTRVHQIFDDAGVVTHEAYDFKGNTLRSSRRLLVDYRRSPDWNVDPELEAGAPYASSATYDALNRTIRATTPDGSVQHSTLNAANLLETVAVNLRGEALTTPFVAGVDYDARGQRTRIVYGNGAETTYTYDPLTFRLARLRTIRPAGSNGDPSRIFVSSTVVQDLHYTYDPVGNLTRIEDAALRTVVHGGQRVEPVSRYTHDARYQLIEARGREHIRQNVLAPDRSDGDHRDRPFAGSQVNDLQALRRYTERYEYDAVGNFEVMRHLAEDGGWTRRYDYLEASLFESDRTSNRLTLTAVGDGAGHVETYTYDAHGNIASMPHLTAMRWDFEDRLQGADLGGGGTVHYVYDGAGQRVRKIVESRGGVRRKERVYLGGFELYRRFAGNGLDETQARETLHVMDGPRRVALVETRTVVDGDTSGSPVPNTRYQLGNHLASASVELADDGALVSYEEYHPYGTTAFQVQHGEVPAKRYRYSGKERDEESGFTYHGARYYSAWLGRWISSDPALHKTPGFCSYLGMGNNPVVFIDEDGREITVARIEQAADSRPLIRINITAALLDETPRGIRARTLTAIRDQIEQTIEEAFTGESENLRWEMNIDLRLVGSESEVRPGEHVFRIRRPGEGIGGRGNPESAIVSGRERTQPTDGGEAVTSVTYHRGIYLSTAIWRLAREGQGDFGFFAAHGMGHALGLLHPDQDPDAPENVEDNLMNSTYDTPESGVNVEEFQILQIERSFRSQERQLPVLVGLDFEGIPARININGPAQREEDDTFIPPRIRGRLPPAEIRRLLRRRLRPTPTEPVEEEDRLRLDEPFTPSPPGLGEPLNPGPRFRLRLNPQ